MKRANILITNLLILAVGVIFLLLFSREGVMEWIVIVSGIMFVVAGVINGRVLAAESSKSKSDAPAESKEEAKSEPLNSSPAKSKQKGQGSPLMHRVLGWLCTAAAIVFGAMMIVVPDKFVSLLAYILSASLFVGGCYHIYKLGRGMRPVVMPFWTYVLPLMLVVGSVVMFIISLNSIDSAHIILIISGVGLILFAVETLIQYIVRKVLTRKITPKDTSNITAISAPLSTEQPELQPTTPNE